MKNWMIILSVLGVLSAVTAKAGLVLNINTNDQTFAMFGSDSGTSSGNYLRWELSGGTPAVNYGAQRLSLMSAIMVDPAEVDDAVIELQQVFGYSRSVGIGFNRDGYYLIEGTELFRSYASIDSATIVDFEDLIGQTLALKYGTGYEDIQVQAVPEPSTSLLLLISSGVMGALRRWVKK